jgi:hypothetical protein
MAAGGRGFDGNSGTVTSRRTPWYAGLWLRDRIDPRALDLTQGFNCAQAVRLGALP